MTTYRVIYPVGASQAVDEFQADEAYVNPAEGGLVFKLNGVVVKTYGQWIGIETVS